MLDKDEIRSSEKYELSYCLAALMQKIINKQLDVFADREHILFF